MEEKEEKTTEIQDDVYRLQEMADEMEKSLDNLKKVREEQIYLVEVLTNVKDEKLNKLVEELQEQIKIIDKQIEKLTTRQIMVQDVCKACDSIDIRMVVNNLLVGLGVFSQE